MRSHHEDFDELYRTHSRRLTVALYAYTADMQLAQDLVQEAFCRALARWPRIRNYEDPVGWVRRVSWNLAASSWRKALRSRSLFREPRRESVPGPEPDRIVLMDSLATLPVNQRRAVIMYYLGDMSISDIAEQENASANTIKQRLHRARTTLAEKLRDPIPEADHA